MIEKKLRIRTSTLQALPPAQDYQNLDHLKVVEFQQEPKIK